MQVAECIDILLASHLGHISIQHWKLGMLPISYRNLTYIDQNFCSIQFSFHRKHDRIYSLSRRTGDNIDPGELSLEFTVSMVEAVQT